MSRLSPHFRHSTGLLGLLVAVMALVSLLALGATVLPDDRPADPTAALKALVVFCQTGHPLGDKPAPAHRMPQATLCPLSVTLALPAAIPAPMVFLPAPPGALALRFGAPPPARAPPSLAVMAAYPRGPPFLA